MARLPTYSDPEVLAKIAGLGLRARRLVEGTIQGLHRSPFHGLNVEFAEYREYSPGDDLRRLDWRVYGRTDRHYIKQYEDESNLRATLVVDSSASMTYGSGALTKFESAATIAAAMATLLIAQQDPVGLALADNQRRDWLPPSATQAQLAEIVSRLETVQPGGETDLGAVLTLLSEQLPARGLVVVISDLLTDLTSFYDGVARLDYRGHEVLLVHVLDRDELELPFRDLVLFRDIEGDEELLADPSTFRNAYQAAMHEFLEGVRRDCGMRGIDHVLLQTDVDLGVALRRYLHLRQRILTTR